MITTLLIASLTATASDFDDDCTPQDVYRERPELQAWIEEGVAASFNDEKFNAVLTREYTIVPGLPSLPVTPLAWTKTVWVMKFTNTFRSCDVGLKSEEWTARGVFNGTWGQAIDLALLWVNSSPHSSYLIDDLLSFNFIEQSVVTWCDPETGLCVFNARPVEAAAKKIALDEEAVHTIGMMAYGLDLTSLNPAARDSLQIQLARLYEASGVNMRSLAAKAAKNPKYPERVLWEGLFLRRYLAAGSRQDLITQYRVFMVLAAKRLRMPIAAEWAVTVNAEVVASHLAHKAEYAAILAAIDH